MAMNSNLSFGLIAIFAIVFVLVLPSSVHGHGHEAFAPAPAPTSDGTAIDQGIAYVLMMLALALTYVIHTFDVPIN